MKNEHDYYTRSTNNSIESSGIINRRKYQSVDDSSTTTVNAGTTDITSDDAGISEIVDRDSKRQSGDNGGTGYYPYGRRRDGTPRKRPGRKPANSTGRDRYSAYTRSGYAERHAGTGSGQNPEYIETPVPGVMDSLLADEISLPAIKELITGKSVEMLFELIAVVGGSHWKLSIEESNLLGKRIKDALSTLPKTTAKNIEKSLGKYFPWVALIGTGYLIAAPRIEITKLQRYAGTTPKNDIPKQGTIYPFTAKAGSDSGVSESSANGSNRASFKQYLADELDKTLQPTNTIPA
jgi:hypothetical protein